LWIPNKEEVVLILASYAVLCNSDYADIPWTGETREQGGLQAGRGGPGSVTQENDSHVVCEQNRGSRD
jgi:hypothetical protein